MVVASARLPRRRSAPPDPPACCFCSGVGSASCAPHAFRPAIGHQAGLLDVGEERLHRVEIARGERVELVVVTLGAAERAAQPDGASGAHAVGGVLGEILLGLQAAFGGGAVQAVVGRRHALLDGGVRHQVAGQLLARELVERLVVAERAQHVVAIGPGGEGVVAVEAAGVGVAHDVEPVHGLLLGVARRGQQAVDQLLVGVRRRVFQEGVDLFGRWAASPVRSSETRRISVRRSASGEGFSPSRASRSWMKASIGFALRRTPDAAPADRPSGLRTSRPPPPTGGWSPSAPAVSSLWACAGGMMRAPARRRAARWRSCRDRRARSAPRRSAWASALRRGDRAASRPCGHSFKTLAGKKYFSIEQKAYRIAIDFPVIVKT